MVPGQHPREGHLRSEQLASLVKILRVTLLRLRLLSVLYGR